MRTVCTSGIKNSASQTCTQCPPAEQLILHLLLSVFSKETKNVVRARSAASRRIVHTYRTKTIALCIMHYACCAVSAVLSNSPVLCSPARSFVCLRLKNPIREQIRHPFRFWPAFFVFCEVGRRKRRRRMRRRKRMRKRSWGSLGWCSADGGSGCKAVAGVKWEVVGGVGADEWKPRCRRDRGFLGLVVGNFRGRGTLRQDLTSDDLGKAKRGFFLAGSG